MPDDEQQNESRGSLPEKVTLTVSLLIVVALVGYLAWHDLRNKENAPPRIVARVRTDQAARQEGSANGWTVPVEVRNQGAGAVEDVQVTIESIGADGKPEELDITLGYLPARGGETTLVVLERPPESARPRARVRAFKQSKDAQGY